MCSSDLPKAASRSAAASVREKRRRPRRRYQVERSSTKREIALVAAAGTLQKQVILPPGWRKPAGPHSHAVKAGDTLFVSGLLSQDGRDGGPVPGTLQVQTKTILDNLGAILRAASMDYGDVVAARLFFAGENDVPAVNAVYNPYFGKTPPARHGVHARMISGDYLVTLNFVAVKPAAGSSERVAVAGAVGTPNQIGRAHV